MCVQRDRFGMRSVEQLNTTREPFTENSKTGLMSTEAVYNSAYNFNRSCPRRARTRKFNLNMYWYKNLYKRQSKFESYWTLYYNPLEGNLWCGHSFPSQYLQMSLCIRVVTKLLPMSSCMFKVPWCFNSVKPFIHKTTSSLCLLYVKHNPFFGSPLRKRGIHYTNPSMFWEGNIQSCLFQISPACFKLILCHLK